MKQPVGILGFGDLLDGIEHIGRDGDIGQGECDESMVFDVGALICIDVGEACIEFVGLSNRIEGDEENGRLGVVVFARGGRAWIDVESVVGEAHGPIGRAHAGNGEAEGD